MSERPIQTDEPGDWHDAPEVRMLATVRFVKERLADHFRVYACPLGVRAALDELENYFVNLRGADDREGADPFAEPEGE